MFPIQGIAAEDIRFGDECYAGGSCTWRPLVTLADMYVGNCVALNNALYGDYITVLIFDNNNKECSGE